ncbi:hypothetical protein PI124_g17206 [Phytophthora idaei]|nr:hypothetical protein PI125_g13924 [Phytophthora idaei]KAG3146429.1 hypothetical protein PI126_g13330 [Phytophthora idaei]KAG3237819.1 hypothetical protein PI124_g17206 [Phytophthora idaei]
MADRLSRLYRRSDRYFDTTPVDYAARDIMHFAALRPAEALDHMQRMVVAASKSDEFFEFFTAAMGHQVAGSCRVLGAEALASSFSAAGECR